MFEYELYVRQKVPDVPWYKQLFFDYDKYSIDMSFDITYKRLTTEQLTIEKLNTYNLTPRMLGLNKRVPNFTVNDWHSCIVLSYDNIIDLGIEDYYGDTNKYKVYVDDMDKVFIEYVLYSKGYHYIYLDINYKYIFRKEHIE